MHRSKLHEKSSDMPDFTAAFDSATAMVMSLSQFLEGDGFPGTGALPSSETLGKIIDFFPDSWKKKAYSKTGSFDGLDPEDIESADISALEKWVIDCYPKRKYPAIAIGSSNGALVHLYAALGIPWLPQTFLVPIKTDDHLDKDRPKEIMEWAKKPAEKLLKKNPDVVLHHMMDPNHDRLHLNKISYFRVKKIKLSSYYQKFIDQCLDENGTILMINCQFKWPVVRLGSRYVFQFGGAGGGIKPTEYYEGSERIRNFLKQQDADVSTWDAPDFSEEAPEAEWGFQAELQEDITSLCRKNNYLLDEIRFTHPEQPSAFVANLYKHWYRTIGRPDDQLLVECFALHDPYWAIKTASVPLWLLFNDQDSADFAKAYLKEQDQFEKIYLMLMSHGIQSVGLADIKQWDQVKNLAKEKGEYVGVNPEDYPQDFGVYLSYYDDLKEKIDRRYALPTPLSLAELRDFYDADNPPFQWERIE